MKNGRGPLNKNGPKENEANIIDGKLNLNKLQSLEINTSNLRMLLQTGTPEQKQTFFATT